MIKSCYPTFQAKDKDNKLQRLSLSDRWVRGGIGGPLSVTSPPGLAPYCSSPFCCWCTVSDDRLRGTFRRFTTQFTLRAWKEIKWPFASSAYPFPRWAINTHLLFVYFLALVVHLIWD
jgi:hypothetical protein